MFEKRSKPILWQRFRGFCRPIARLLLPLASVALLGAPAVGSSFPQARLAVDGEAVDVEFHAAGDLAVLTERHADGSVELLRSVNDVPDAIAVLADQQLSFAWPALLAWAGPDLIKLRDRAVERYRLAAEAGMLAAAPKGPSENWSGSASVTGTLAYTRVLSNSGQNQAAVEILKGAIKKIPQDAEHKLGRVILIVRLAMTDLAFGRTDEAIALLSAAETDRSLEGDFKLNLDVNLASALAIIGQYKQALELIDRAWQTYTISATETKQYTMVPSSEAHFAGIRACALAGLDDHAAANALLNSIVPGVSKEESDSVDAAKTSAYYCMHDDAALAHFIAQKLAIAKPADDVFISIQLGNLDYPANLAVLSAALQRPELAKAIAIRGRVLGHELGPAVNGWAPAISGASPAIAHASGSGRS